METSYELPNELWKNILEFLLSLPSIETVADRKALIHSAGLDRNLFIQIEFEGKSFSFFGNLITDLVLYGKLRDKREALVAVLEAARKQVGQDKQAYCDTLIHIFKEDKRTDSLIKELQTLRKKLADMVNDRLEVAIAVSTTTLRSLTDEQKNKLVDSIASMLGVSSKSIEVYGLTEGSVVFELGVPIHTVERLHALAKSPDNIFQQLGVTQIVLRKKGYLDTIVPALQETYQHVRAEYQHVLFEQEGGLDLKEFSFDTVTVNERGDIITGQQQIARQYTEDLGHDVTLDMVTIPGGSFLMGASENEHNSQDDERPQHQVTVSPFFMGKYPVMQAQWEVIMGTNPARFKGPQRPVEHVSWNDAQEFCRKLSEKTGASYRLPTEAEWEYACRAGTTTAFFFGETITPELVSYDRRQTTDVGSFPPNAFGLYDMHGNVWEWCQDVWHDNYTGAPADGSAWESDTGSDRVIRGGAWLTGAGSCRAAYRDDWHPSGRVADVGFRLLRTPL